MSYHAYVNEFYKNLDAVKPEYEQDIQELIDSIIQLNRLGLYDKIEGIEKALERISKRRKINSSINITLSTVELKEHFNVLIKDFNVFFPQLQEHISLWCKNNGYKLSN